MNKNNMEIDIAQIKTSLASTDTNNTKKSNYINLSDFEYMEQFNLGYCKCQGKRPFETAWQNTPLTHKTISDYVDFKNQNNYGVLTGVNDLIVIDCDIPSDKKDAKSKFPEKKDILINLIKEKFPETLEVTTGSGGKHFYFYCPDMEQKIIMDLFDKELEKVLHCGEIQYKGQQVVGPSSLHPNGNYYEITNKKSIATIALKDIKEVLALYMIDHKIAKPKITSKMASKKPVQIIKGQNAHPQEYNILSDPKIHKIFNISDTEETINHPIHGSTNGGNFKIDTKTNKFTCFRCNVSGGSLKAIALKEGIVECSELDNITNAQYTKIKAIGLKKYGLKFKDTDKLQQFLDDYKIYFIESAASNIYGILHVATRTVILKNGLCNLAEHLRYLLCSKVSFDTANSYIQFENDKGKMVNKTNESFVKGLFEVKGVYNEGFKPVGKLTFETEGLSYLNTYKPNQYLTLKKTDEVIDFAKECPDIDYVISNLTSQDPKGKTYLLKLMAFMLQKPYVRTGKVVSFYGSEGSGKGIFYDKILSQLFGEKQCAFLDQSDLEGQYNGLMAGKLVVWFNEIKHKSKYEDKLKKLSTSKTTAFNVKYGSNYEADIYFTVFADCNGETPLYAGHRRSAIYKSESLGGSRSESDKLGPILASKIPSQLSTFAKYLMNLEVSFDDINNVYDTQAKRDIEERNMSNEESFIHHMGEYTSWENFLIATLDSPAYPNGVPLDKIHDTYLKDGFVCINAFLDAYNGFLSKQNQKYSKLDMRKFKWIYDSFKINRKDKTQFMKITTHGKRNYYISLALANQKCTAQEEEK